MTSYDISNSSFIDKPLEKHGFSGADFNCSICRRPRAMHQHDGFMPSKAAHSVTMDFKARYGSHPYFFRPGRLILNKAEQAEVDRLYSRSGRKSPDKLDPESVTVAEAKVRRIGSIQIEI